MTAPRYEPSDYQFVNALRAVLGLDPIAKTWEKERASASLPAIAAASCVSDDHSTDRLILPREFARVMMKARAESEGVTVGYGRLFLPAKALR